MTIRRNVDLSVLSDDYRHFEEAADTASEGTFNMAKNLKEVIGSTVDDFIATMRLLNLDIENCDGAREIEALLYGWVRSSNPSVLTFKMTEDFGRALDDADRFERGDVIRKFEGAYLDGLASV